MDLLLFFRRLAPDCPPEARALGLLREHGDIAKRHAKVRGAWASHLAASKTAILEAADRVVARHSALVIGAGDCLDVPVAELTERFDRVVLADIVVGAGARAWARKSAGGVECVSWDASGALAAAASRRDTLTAAEAPKVFAQADPGPPPGGEPDFIVSANCISQLGLVPGHSLPAAQQDTGLPERCGRAAAKRHVQWLEARSGARLLLGDVARLNIAPDGRELKRENLASRYGLPKPDKLWRWDLAPIPEWSPEFHRVHEVGAWFWPAG
ncbi:MAG TPA: hypothetical protein VG936_17155 [Lacunisphaera sp.]|nr:hypothetical protein [Lacunisphaera sp.]